MPSVSRASRAMTSGRAPSAPIIDRLSSAIPPDRGARLEVLHGRQLVEERRALVVAVARHHEDRVRRRHRRHPREQLQAVAARPVDVLEQDQHRPPGAPQQRLHRAREAELGRVGLDLGGVGHVAIEERAQVGHERFEDARLVVRRIRQQQEPADHVAPHLVRAAALAHLLPAQHGDAVDERARPHLLQQARFADAALAPDQPGAALAAEEPLQQRREVIELGAPPHEARCLEEALARVHRLDAEALAGRVGERGHHLGRVGVAVARVPGEEAGDHRRDPRIDAREIGRASRTAVRRPAKLSAWKGHSPVKSS